MADDLRLLSLRQQRAVGRCVAAAYNDLRGTDPAAAQALLDAADGIGGPFSVAFPEALGDGGILAGDPRFAEFLGNNLAFILPNVGNGGAGVGCTAGPVVVSPIRTGC